MRTIVLLATFLLAASANPIEGHYGSTEDTANTEDVSRTGHNSEWSMVDTAANDTEGEHGSVDNRPYSSSDAGEGGSGDAGTGDAAHDDTDTSSDSSVSTSPTRDGGDTGSGNGVNGGADTEDTQTSSVNSASATPTTVEHSTQESTYLTTPADGDPDDCKNANKPNHTFRLCSYMCDGDEMFNAPDNRSCYLNQTEATVASFGVRSTMESNATGICKDGSCVQLSMERPTSIPTTEPPTTISTTETSTSTSTSAAETNNSQDANNL